MKSIPGLGVDLAFNWRRIGLGTRLVLYMMILSASILFSIHHPMLHVLLCSHPSAETAISEIVAESVLAGAIVGGGVFLILVIGLLFFVLVVRRRSQRGKVSK